MKRLFRLFAVALVACTAIASCGSDDGGNLTPGLSLKNISAENYPAEEDLWIIADQSATAANYSGLIAALKSVSYNESDREISLSFPNLTAVADGAFLLGATDSSVSLNSLVSVSANLATEIGESAFEGCRKLERADFPVATAIGASAFEECLSLENTSFGCVKSVGRRAFSRCAALESVKLYQATEIGSEAFAFCTSLESVDLSSLEVANSALLSGCVALKSVELPKATTLCADSFASCIALESVEAPAAVSLFEPFSGCAALQELELATESGAIITDFTTPFYGVTTENITLTLGTESYEEFVRKETLFIFSDNKIYEFAAIIED